MNLYKSFVDHATSPYTMSDLHFLLLCVWIVLAFPTLLLWRDSVPWLSFMSVYAIIVSHFGAYASARTEQKIDEQLES